MNPKSLYYPTEKYVCTCTTKLYVFCTGAYNYYQQMIIPLRLPITHLIQIILNKHYLDYMYPSIYIRAHYYIFNSYLYLKKMYILIIIIIMYLYSASIQEPAQ